MIRKISSIMALFVSILALAAFANDLPNGSVMRDLAQSMPSTLDSARSLGEFLTSDGRFDLEAARRSGYQGALDLKGFKSAIDPATGQPLFRPASPASPTDDPDDIYWDNRISPSVAGVSGTVNAMTVYDGKLVVGGTFLVVRDVFANYIAAWDGTSWSALGSGTDGTIEALTIYNGSLIAGGRFTSAGGTSAHYVASWNGNA
jgi:hypothetical protein